MTRLMAAIRQLAPRGVANDEAMRTVHQQQEPWEPYDRAPFFLTGDPGIR